MSEVMGFSDIEYFLDKFFKEEAYVYLRKKHGTLIRHYNGQIVSYSRSKETIEFKDDKFLQLIKIDKKDIVFIDYSRNGRQNG